MWFRYLLHYLLCNMMYYLSASPAPLRKARTDTTPASHGSLTPGATMRSAASTVSGRQGASKAQRAEQLVQAAASGNVQELLRCLDAAPGGPDAVGWAGVTPLMAAARHGRGAALELLLEARADVLRTDVRGRTALDHAFRRPETEEHLRAWGAFTGRELQRQATSLARRVLRIEEERRRLEAKCAKLPSKEVRERILARRGSMSMPDWSPKRSPDGSPHMSPEMSPTGNPVAWPRARPRGDAPLLLAEMPEGRSGPRRSFTESPELEGSGDLGRALAEPGPRRSPAGTAEAGQLPSALARRTPTGSPPVKRERPPVRITLPVESRHAR
ncbi:unnamed protein product [Prorocentrum cordatum]|uniref:Uncharacterized protein n=1 Tax=Prorocentrum cordatum TaxID=2364126 RepID=A0ABN9YCS9_9DINO|nr:unnamed protein product [Polarella glacialis]